MTLQFYTLYTDSCCVAYCGGSELQCTPKAAKQLVDDFISKFLPLARVALICSAMWPRVNQPMLTRTSSNNGTV